MVSIVVIRRGVQVGILRRRKWLTGRVQVYPNDVRRRAAEREALTTS